MEGLTALFVFLGLSAALPAVVNSSSGPCDNIKCLNGGTCHVDHDKQADCLCGVHFIGDRCEFNTNTTLCSKHPCKNGGSCGQQKDEATVTCFCVPGYHGMYCDLDYNDCLSSPCVHGQCVDGVNSYTCNCTGTSWTGTLCELQTLRSQGHKKWVYVLIVGVPLTVLIVAVIRIYFKRSCCKRRRRGGPYVVLNEELYSPDSYSIPMTRWS